MGTIFQMILIVSSFHLVRIAAGKTIRVAVDQGFTGTIEEWLATQGDTTGIQNQINDIKTSVIWIDGM